MTAPPAGGASQCSATALRTTAQAAVLALLLAIWGGVQLWRRPSPVPLAVRGARAAREKPRWLRTVYWFDNAGLSTAGANRTELHVERSADPAPHDDPSNEDVMSRMTVRLYPGPVPCPRTLPGRTLFAAKLHPQYGFETNPMHALHDVIAPLFTALLHARRRRAPVARIVTYHPFPRPTGYLGGLLTALCSHFNVEVVQQPADAALQCFEALLVSGYDTLLRFDSDRGYHKSRMMAHLRQIVLQHYGLGSAAPAPGPNVHLRIFPRHGTSRELTDLDCVTQCLRDALRPQKSVDVEVMTNVTVFGDMVRQYHGADVYLESSGGQAANHLFLPSHAAVFTFSPCFYVPPLSWYGTLPYIPSHNYYLYRWCETKGGKAVDIGGYHPRVNVSCALLQSHIVPRILKQVRFMAAVQKAGAPRCARTVRQEFQYSQGPAPCPAPRPLDVKELKSQHGRGCA